MNRIEDRSAINWHAHVRVDKYSADQVRWVTRMTGCRNPSGGLLRETLKCLPDEVLHADGNLLTYVGLAYLLSNITGVTTTTTAHVLSNGFLPVAVGDGNGSVPTAAVTDTDLTAPTNKYYNPVDASYPTVGAAGSSAGVITVQSTFTGLIANFAWNEWALFGTTANFTVGQSATPSSSTMINHKGVSLGTKTSGSAWTLSATLTLS